MGMNVKYQVAVWTNMPVYYLSKIIGAVDTFQNYVLVHNSPGKGCKFCGNAEAETRMGMCLKCFENASRSANNVYVTRNMYDSMEHAIALAGTAMGSAERNGFKYFGVAVIPAGTKPPKDRVKYRLEDPLKVRVDYGSPSDPKIFEMRSPYQRFYASKKLEHPSTVIVPPNEFYKNGLREVDIHKYYDTVKDVLLQHNNGLDGFILIKVDDKLVVRRTAKIYIKSMTINSESFEALNTGRTVEYHFAIGKQTVWVWVDLDPQEEFPFDDVKSVAVDIAKKLPETLDVINTSVRFSGKTGMHVVCILQSPMDTDTARLRIKEFVKDYIDHKKDPRLTDEIATEKNQMRIDYSTLHDTGGLRMPYSLAYPTGLVCLPIKAGVGTFKKEDAGIDRVLETLGKFPLELN